MGWCQHPSPPPPSLLLLCLFLIPSLKILLVTSMFSDYFFRSLNLFQCQSLLTCLSVIHSCLFGMQRALVFTHIHKLPLLCLILTSCTLPYSCAVWHWDIRILKFKATNGRLLMLSTNTYHTQAPNLFISFKMCVYEYMMSGSEYHETISWWRNTHTPTCSRTNSKNYLPMAVKGAGCVTVQWLGQGQWYNSFI